MTQLSAARAALADLGVQASVAGMPMADAGGNTHPHTDPLATQVCAADLSCETSEPMLPLTVAWSLQAGVLRPAGHTRVTLPQPLIKGLQRPPKALRA